MQTVIIFYRYDNSENEDDDEDYFDDLYSIAIQPTSNNNKTTDSTHNDDCDVLSHNQSYFFQRSESMAFLGCSDRNPFEV